VQLVTSEARYLPRAAQPDLSINISLRIKGLKCAGTQGNAVLRPAISAMAFPGLKGRFFCANARFQAGKIVFDIIVILSDLLAGSRRIC